MAGTLLAGMARSTLAKSAAWGRLLHLTPSLPLGGPTMTTEGVVARAIHLHARGAKNTHTSGVYAHARALTRRFCLGGARAGRATGRGGDAGMRFFSGWQKSGDDGGNPDQNETRGSERMLQVCHGTETGPSLHACMSSLSFPFLSAHMRNTNITCR